MLVGLLMLLAPGLVFLVTLPWSGRLRPRLRWLYRILGGAVVFGGSALSYYFAAYTGDQGGIAAYFFQMAVIATYALLSLLLVALDWVLHKRDAEEP